MPLTALLPVEAVFDATACSDADWAGVHKAKPRAVLACRGCGHPVHAKASKLGFRFFAHDAVQADCPTNGETPEHRELKALLAAAIRDAGGTAVVEAYPDATDIGGWRADVLGVGPGGHRVAFEVQLAAMTVETGLERSAKYDADGIQVVWVSPRSAHWLYALPGMSVRVVDGALELMEGVAVWRELSWSVWREQAAQPVVKAWLEDRMRVASPVSLFEERERGWLANREAVVWSNVAMVGAWEKYQVAETMRREQAAVAAARHQANIDAMYERQERVLQAVVPQVAVQHPDGRVWLGVPATPWNGELPVRLQEALGNEKTGRGCVVWVGASRDALRLHNVVCPVASQLSPELGASWRRRGVTVVAESAREASKLTGALNWHTGDVRLG